VEDSDSMSDIVSLQNIRGSSGIIDGKLLCQSIFLTNKHMYFHNVSSVLYDAQLTAGHRPHV